MVDQLLWKASLRCIYRKITRECSYNQHLPQRLKLKCKAFSTKASVYPTRSSIVNMDTSNLFIIWVWDLGLYTQY